MNNLYNKILATLALILLLSGCKQEHIDISEETKYRDYIGRTYVVVKDMRIIGINSSPGYGDKIDFYVITKKYEVEHTSPEEVTQDIFEKGASFKILSIKECSNCLWFTKPKHAVVATENYPKNVGVPIIVPLHEIREGDSLALEK